METFSEISVGKGEQANELTLVTPAHQALFRKLGCQWPAPADEAAWLNTINADVVVGSQDARGLPQPDEIANARKSFFDALPLVNQKRLVRRAQGMTGVPSKTIRALVTIDSEGLNVATVASANASFLEYDVTSIQQHLAGLRLLELDVNKVAARSGMLSLSPGTLSARMQPLYAAGRIAGIPRETVVEVINHTPGVIGPTASDIRLLTRVMLETVEDFDIDDIKSSLLALSILPSECLVAAHVVFGDVIRSARALRTHAQRYSEEFNKQALQGLILEYPDDPVVKYYLKQHPLDEEAAATARDVYKRVRERRDSGLYLGGIIQNMLSIETTSFYAVEGNVKGIPRLTEDELGMLDNTIAKGMEAAAKLDTHILDDEEEWRGRAVKTAQDALITHHIYLATEAVRRWFGPRLRDDMGGTALLALTKAARRYVPGNESFEVFATEMINAALGHAAYPHRKSDEDSNDS